MSTFKTYLLSLIILLISTSAFAQGNSGPSPTGGAHPGIGTCPAGQVINRLAPDVGPPFGCVSIGGAGAVTSVSGGNGLTVTGPASTPTVNLPAGTAGQILAENALATAFVPVTLSGSCTITSLGVITCPTVLSPFTGAIEITGNQGNGSDFIGAADGGVCINGVCPATAFGASGSAATCSGTIAANSTSLALSGCSPSNDFKNKEWVLIPQAGPAALPTGATPTVTGVGTAFTGGSTNWTYEVAYRDRWGGIIAASSAVTLSTGSSSAANSVGYAKIVLGAQAGGYSYCDVGVYRTAAASGIPTGLIGVIPGCSTSATLGDTNLPIVTSSAFPASPPAGATNQYLVAQITAGGGTSTVTIGTAASSVAPGTAVTVIHDETQAIQACVTAASGINGKCHLPGGTYNIDQPSFWNGSAWVYTNPTDTSTTANEMFGTVHLASNLTVDGDDWSTTILKSPYLVNLDNYTLAVSNPTATRIPGALCNSGAYQDLTTKAINNVVRGSNVVTTTTATDAGTFSAGDIVIVGGGVVSSLVSCGNTPRYEANKVVAVDSVTGNVWLEYGLLTDFPYGTAGTASFIAKANTWYYHDITIQNLTIDSTGGGGALSLQSTVKARVDRIKMTGEKWSVSYNLGGSRDTQTTNSFWYSTGGEEMDQANDIIFDRNYLKQESGSNQLSFDEGTSGIKYTNNSLNSDDFLTGINNRSGVATAFVVTCANDLQVEGNSFNVVGTNVNTNTVINQASPCNATGQPLPFNWRIAHNHIKQTVPVGIGIAIAESGSSIENQVIEANDIFESAGVGNSYGIEVKSGNITKNVIRDGNGHMGGLIGVLVSGALTTPINIEGNILTANTNAACIQLSNTASIPLYVHKNTCVSSGNAITIAGTVNATNYPLTYIDPQDTASTYTAGAVFGLGATHGIQPPTSAGSGTLTTGSTDNYFELTGTTAFTDTITFHQTFKNKPVCSCSDETTQAALSCLVSTTTAIVGAGTSNDSFVCQVSGY